MARGSTLVRLKKAEKMMPERMLWTSASRWAHDLSLAIRHGARMRAEGLNRTATERRWVDRVVATCMMFLADTDERGVAGHRLLSEGLCAASISR